MDGHPLHIEQLIKQMGEDTEARDSGGGGGGGVQILEEGDDLDALGL